MSSGRMTKSGISKWTLVQHSGYGFNNNPQFKHAVEEVQVTTAAQVKRVTDAGGMVFDSYMQAHEACMKENYPPDMPERNLIPKVKGTFKNVVVHGLKVYVPQKPAPIGAGRGCDDVA